MKHTDVTTGLSKDEVHASKAKHGSNTLTTKKKDGFFRLFIESLGDPIIKILLVALGIKILFLFKQTDYYETIGIFIAILLASLISSISEYGSGKAFDKLQEESAKIKCRVRRNGTESELNIEEVVYGDIVILESGDRIPADGVVLKGSLKIDESSLTGESKEVSKKVNGELYRGTVVNGGNAIMFVNAVGDHTYYGSIASELLEKSPTSPLKDKLSHLAKIISTIGYIGAILVAFSYLFKVLLIDNNFDIELIKATLNNGPLLFDHLLHALTLAVTIIVVAVPEGLPMMITLVLSSNMQRMLKSNVLVRKLSGIETSGSLNVLYTDKTGTLTKGNLELSGVILGDGSIFRSYGEVKNYKKFNEVFYPSIVYNNACKKIDGKLLGGNTTDKAILGFADGEINYKYNILKEIPFDSKNKYSIATIDMNKETTLFKGAYERILPHITHYYDKSGEKKYLKDKKFIENIINDYSSRGYRILIMASSPDRNLNKLTMVSLLLLKDEIRTESIEGIKLVKSAGINTVMITGDNKNTAVSIAKEVGLLESESDIVITSEELNRMADEEIKKIIPNLKVVARSLPSDKSKLIRLSRELELVVGMTGDGVNDAPALKAADIGFSMGSGTEVAKEASDIVIVDDNILSISNAVMFGRTTFKSIRKFIIFQLTVNFCAIALSIIGPYIGIETPVTVIQMLWINMVMDTLAGLAFAFEPPLKEYMKERPKKRNEAIINKYMFNEILITGTYSSILLLLFLKLPIFTHIFDNQDHLMTAFFGLFIFISIFNSFNARSHRLNIVANILKNKVFLIIIALIVVVQLILIYFGGEVFRTTGLNLVEFQVMMLLAFTVIPIDFIRKSILRRRGVIGGV